jgi:hypothetical protein
VYPPVFAIVAADVGVQAALGTNPVRFFPFSQAPDDVTMPYAVWQTVSGSPENYLAGLPDIDGWMVQVDVYAETGRAARTAAQALRDAIEPEAYIVAWRGESKEDDGIFRYSFDVGFLTQR